MNINKAAIGIVLLIFNITNCRAQQNGLPDCEWCGATEVSPDNLSWQTKIAAENEEGERLIISGIVLNHDGKTPAQNVVLYLYHTNNKGIYPKRGDEKGNGKRHGSLRGWVKTNERGEYKISTIKPASYPSGTEPAHIHITIKEPERDEYWIDPTIFDGDTLITDHYKNRLRNIGGSGIISISREGEFLYGKRDIILVDN